MWKETGIERDKIPKSYQILGDIMLLKFLRPVTEKEKRKIGEAFMKLLPYVKSVWEIKGVKGEFREPIVKHIAGLRKTVTVHTEYGIKYKINIRRVMFSKGNHYERLRVAKKIQPGEVVVDMFAGIGYFSLGIAKFSTVRVVYAIEKNPYAYKLLRENIKLNNVDNVKAILGDCRNVSRRKDMQSIADRVIMGYFPGTHRFLPAAIRFAKEGAIIHYHDTASEDELWNGVIDRVKKRIKTLGYSMKILEKRKVKSFAPRIYHVVIDFMI